MRKFCSIAIIINTAIEKISSLTCYYCANGKYDADCLSSAIECPHENQICMTELRQENGRVMISKGCKQRHACEQHVKHDYSTCTENPMTRLCYQCCDTDFCNDNMYLPPLYEQTNICGVTKIQPFLNFNAVEQPDEMWAKDFQIESDAEQIVEDYGNKLTNMTGSPIEGRELMDSPVEEYVIYQDVDSSQYILGLSFWLANLFLF